MTETLPRGQKRVAGRTETPQTPLNVRTTGVNLSQEERGYFRVRLGKKLGKFSPHVERVTVRFEDVNGPKGGVDIECRIKVVLSGMPSHIVSESAETVQIAFNQAADRAVRAVRKAIESSGTRTPKVSRRAVAAAQTLKATGRPPRAAARGSHVGRRVGHGRANIEAAAERPEKLSRAFPVDTAEPGRSASDRKVGAGATATRNTRLRDDGASYLLEDSQQDRPSRKSTRRSTGRIKTDSQLRRRNLREVRAPGTQAERAAANKRGGERV
jgi:ribosome-associated translation inhibitor RaiA